MPWQCRHSIGRHFERVIAGDVVFPGSAAYEELPKPFNARFHDVRPRAIVRCARPRRTSRRRSCSLGRHGFGAAPFAAAATASPGARRAVACVDRRLADGCRVASRVAWPPSALAPGSASVYEALAAPRPRYPRRAPVRRSGWLG